MIQISYTKLKYILTIQFKLEVSFAALKQFVLKTSSPIQHLVIDINAYHNIQCMIQMECERGLVKLMNMLQVVSNSLNLR